VASYSNQFGRRVAPSSGNRIVTAKRLKQEILVFTDSGLYSMQFIGVPDIFGIQPVADNISIMSAYSAVGSATLCTGWVTISLLLHGRPDTLPCSLSNYIFQDINLTQADQVFSGSNESFNEVWWFYCSADSVVSTAILSITMLTMCGIPAP